MRRPGRGLLHRFCRDRRWMPIPWQASRRRVSLTPGPTRLLPDEAHTADLGVRRRGALEDRQMRAQAPVIGAQQRATDPVQVDVHRRRLARAYRELGRCDRDRMRAALALRRRLYGEGEPARTALTCCATRAVELDERRAVALDGDVGSGG